MNLRAINIFCEAGYSKRYMGILHSFFIELTDFSALSGIFSDLSGKNHQKKLT